MADSTGISWADSTFNPWVGCEKVSPGCLGAHCYAEEWANRHADGAVWGKDGVRRRTADSSWAKPRTWERQAAQWAAEHDGRRRRVFCASLADVFEPRPELAPWRIELFDLIHQTPSLDWLILTKRPEVARDYIDAELGAEFADVFPHVWLGTSIENARFTWRADVLRECRVALRFLSCEPLLGSLFPVANANDQPRPNRTLGGALGEPGHVKMPLNLAGIGWVIVGGESGGRDARPMHPSWPREIRDAILRHRPRLHHPPFGYTGPTCGSPALHMKQWGAYAQAGVARPDDLCVEPDGSHRRADAALPSPQSAWMRYAGSGPTSGGKYLDGVDWCEIPDYTPSDPTRLFA